MIEEVFTNNNMSISIIAIIISICAFLVSLISILRLFLLDKDYSEFYLIGSTNKLKYDSMGVDGYKITYLNFKINILKSDAYNINIKGVDSFNVNKNKVIGYSVNYVKEFDILEFDLKFYKPKVIELFYKDSKNNSYKQVINLKPIEVKNNEIKKYSINISNRIWLFYEILRKYFK